MLRLVTRPGEFLSERSENPSLGTPGRLVALAGVVFALEALVVRQTLDPSLVDEIAVQIGIFLGFRFAEPVGMWLIGALVASGAAKVLSGRISYYQSLLAVGWGFPAVALAGVVQVVGYYIALPNVDPPDIAGVGDPVYDPGLRRGISHYNEYIASARSEPVWTLVTVATVACFVWAGYLWMNGVEQYGTGFDRTESAVVAGAAVLVLGYLTI